MLLSTKGRYAVMAMVDLAIAKSDKPVTLAGIAERQEIPLAYLEQIFAKLKKRGIVKSVRGPGGGYQLAKSAHETMIAEIVMASDESLKMTRCNSGSHEGCMAPKTRCLTHDLWEGLGYQIFHYLRSISLADVCERNLKKKFPFDPADMPGATLFAELQDSTHAHA